MMLAGECFRLTGVGVVLGTNVVQLDDVAALAAALKRTVTRHLLSQSICC